MFVSFHRHIITREISEKNGPSHYSEGLELESRASMMTPDFDDRRFRLQLPVVRTKGTNHTLMWGILSHLPLPLNRSQKITR